MNTFEIGEKGKGRKLLINLDRGEKLLESIMEALNKADMKNAVCLSCIGSLQKAYYNRAQGLNDDMILDHQYIEGGLEMVSMQGVVIDGMPHFHFSFSDLKGVYMGHVEEGCEILYLAEILFEELDGVNLTKVKNEKGIAHFTQK